MIGFNPEIFNHYLNYIVIFCLIQVSEIADLLCRVEIDWSVIDIAENRW